jgi:hypothetical protein
MGIPLSAMGDADDLDNQYLGKVILYVEAMADAKFYRECLAIGIDAEIEIKHPVVASGYNGAIAEAMDKRVRNPRVFALLDGEAAADHQGGLSHLLACDTKVFQIPGAATEGIIFLAEHELENILLRLSSVCKFILADEGLGTIGSKDRDTVLAEFETAIDRHLAQAVCKYASMKMSCEARMDGALAVKFFDKPKRVTPWMVKTAVEKLGGDWRAFVKEVRAIRNEIEHRFAVRGPAVAAYDRIRLTDGKTAIARLADRFNVSPKWQGHLMTEIIGHEYFDEMRSEILTITQKAA